MPVKACIQEGSGLTDVAIKSAFLQVDRFVRKSNEQTK